MRLKQIPELKAERDELAKTLRRIHREKPELARLFMRRLNAARREMVRAVWGM